MVKENVYPFIVEFESAVLNISGWKLTAGRPYVTEIGALDQGDVTSIVEISGDIQGAVAISINEGSAIEFADIVTGTTHDRMDNEVEEVIAELVNIFAGQAKKHFEKVAAVSISLPISMHNREFSRPLSDNNLRYICIPYQFNGESKFVLSIAIK
ncbi:MAG: chemotaxis protein CheX [Treponema sp.]|jgi:CheY-specific phosphatase CheX|nr:chemotaxis protein CheX [Treponema sp.]